MKNLHKNIGIFASSLLVTASAVYIYSPVIGSHADSSATAEISVNVADVMALSLDTNELNLSSNPNNFVSGTINATVSTNSQYGYTLTLEDVDANTNLVHTNENVNSVISSNILGSKTSSEMEANTWGYSLNSTDFYRVPVNGAPVTLKHTTTAMTTNTETTPVDFGVKLGNITSGTYSDSVLFTMYVNGQDGNPPVHPNNPGEDTMQGFSCSSLANIGDTTSLTDIRDGKVYSVKKARDGNCWMTKNLALYDYTITSADSDVPDGFSFHVPGDGENESPAPGAQNPWYFQYKFAYLDPTYGGYYNYHTAAGGWNGDGIDTNVNTPQSICPKGWRLPTGTYGGEFDYLYSTAYNYDAIALMEDLQLDLNGQHGGTSNDTPSQQGEIGSWWSASGYSGYSFAQYLWLNPTQTYGKINSAGYASPSFGFGVRCIAR
jgi:uncharacterized protein (TIGR02145 family)